MLLLIALACAPGEEEVYQVPEGATASDYALDGPLTTFPDDLHTVEDGATPTGLRVSFREAAEADLRGQLPESFTIADALEALDGWGTSGGVILRFTAPLDTASVTPETVRWLSLETGEEVTWEAEWTDGDSTLILMPLAPLDPKARYGVAAAGLTDAAGEPVWGSPDLRALLLGEAGEARLEGLYAELLDATGWGAEEIVAATAYTTQSIFEEDDAVAAALAGEVYSFEPGDCADDGTVVSCELGLEVWDLLGEDDVFDEQPLDDITLERRYTLPVTVHLPVGKEGPFPVMIYGHGLGGDRGEARGVARNLADLGMAVAAIDAPAHNEHPGGADSSELFWIFEFFGIDVYNYGFDVIKQRDSWRRAAWDKLQLAAALKGDPDIDGDGAADIDGSRLVFAGHSLGGTMGAQLMRLDPDVAAAELATPGGRVTEIVHRGETFAPLVALMQPDGTDEGDVDRFFPMLQAAVERGDGVNHAPAVLDGRRDVLITQVLDDDIIPNSCTRILATAFGVEHAPPVLQEVALLEVSDPLPLSGNLDGRTALLYQYDEMWDEGALTDATHTHIHSSDSGVAQYHHFWQTWLEGEPAEVIDPMVE
jgi:dienelactone hydrolase